MASKSSSFLRVSILLTTKNTGTFTRFNCSIMKLSPGPRFSLPATTNKTASVSFKDSMAASTMNSPNLCFGLCTPGVSMKTICFASSVYTQIIRLRVV